MYPGRNGLVNLNEVNKFFNDNKPWEFLKTSLFISLNGKAVKLKKFDSLKGQNSRHFFEKPLEEVEHRSENQAKIYDNREKIG